VVHEKEANGSEILYHALHFVIDKQGT